MKIQVLSRVVAALTLPIVLFIANPLGGVLYTFIRDQRLAGEISPELYAQILTPVQMLQYVVPALVILLIGLWVYLVPRNYRESGVPTAVLSRMRTIRLWVLIIGAMPLVAITIGAVLRVMGPDCPGHAGCGFGTGLLLLPFLLLPPLVLSVLALILLSLERKSK